MTNARCLMLALSTAHLAPDTCLTILPALAEDLPVYPKAEYGWFIYADIEINAVTFDLPRDLLGILEHARSRGFDYIMLDRDWPTDPTLPIYAWESLAA